MCHAALIEHHVLDARDARERVHDALKVRLREVVRQLNAWSYELLPARQVHSQAVTDVVTPAAGRVIIAQCHLFPAA